MPVKRISPGRPFASLPLPESVSTPSSTAETASLKGVSHVALKSMRPGLSAESRMTTAWSGALEKTSRVKVTPSRVKRVVAIAESRSSERE